MEHAQQLQTLMALIDKLRAQASVRVGDMNVDPLYSQSNYQGIYEIREPEDKYAVYIGKTKKAKHGVAQRIWDHGKQKGLAETLGVNRKTFADYRVRSIDIPD